MSLSASCLERFVHLHSSLSSSFWIKVRSWTLPRPNDTTYKLSLILYVSFIYITSIKETVYFAYSNCFKEGKKKSVCFFRDLRLHSDRYDKKEKRGETSRMAQPLFFFVLSHFDKTVTERIRPRPSSCHRTPRSPARANRTH